MDQILNQQHKLSLELVSHIVDLHVQLKSKTKSGVSSNTYNKLGYVTETIKNLCAFIDDIREEALDERIGALTTDELKFLEGRKLQSKILTDMQPIILMLLLKYDQSSSFS